jgi:hypothetical protein
MLLRQHTSQPLPIQQLSSAYCVVCMRSCFYLLDLMSDTGANKYSGRVLLVGVSTSAGGVVSHPRQYRFYNLQTPLSAEFKYAST